MRVKPPTIRAFIAVYPDPTVAQKLKNLQTLLRAQAGKAEIRWARPEQLHLTLQFLGHLAPERLPAFEQAIAVILARHRSFDLAAESLGCFPSENRPRILWAGLTGEIARLQDIKAQLDTALQPLGYEPEKRAFHPHITLARIGEVKRNALVTLQKHLTANRSLHLGGWRVEGIQLMQSLLSPAGARYVALKNFPLNQIKASVA